MTLFQQTIKEYLTDNHPNWKIVNPANLRETTYLIRNKAITNKSKYQDTVMYIRSDPQEMTTNNARTWEPYTENTMLQQITIAINNITNKTQK